MNFQQFWWGIFDIRKSIIFVFQGFYCDFLILQMNFEFIKMHFQFLNAFLIYKNAFLIYKNAFYFYFNKFCSIFFLYLQFCKYISKIQSWNCIFSRESQQSLTL